MKGTNCKGNGDQKMLKVIKGRLNTVFFVGREGGFTIVELMVATALSLIVMTGIYTVYHSQQKS